MTTITYRSGILCADTMACSGSIRHLGVYVKIVQAQDGTMGGAAGEAGFCEAWKAFVLGYGPQPTALPSDDRGDGDIGVIVGLDGTLTCHDAGGCYTLNDPYFATGSGDGIAYGAFYMGATAEEAIRAAIAHDLYTGGEPTILELPKQP